MSDEPATAGDVGVVVVTHGTAGQEMVAAAERMVGALRDVRIVRMETGEPRDALEQRLDDAVHQLAAGEVLFLVDLVGSTPARLCMRSSRAVARSAARERRTHCRMRAALPAVRWRTVVVGDGARCAGRPNLACLSALSPSKA